MMQPGQRRNYRKKLDRLIEGPREEGRVLKLLLHNCCAPYNSCVLKYLSRYFGVTMYYYNPDILPGTEYEARVREQERPIQETETGRPVRFLAGSHEPEEFFSVARDHEEDPEDGGRRSRCYELRLGRVTRVVVSEDLDYFTTTLSVSPLKNTQRLNDIGCRLARQYGIPYLVPDFKKRNGYKCSVELSMLYGLYRQDYCGCVYPRAEAIGK